MRTRKSGSVPFRETVLSAANTVRVQFWLLFGASLVALWLAPDIWHYSPDGGIYVGTAKNLVETGAYWFNGQPNLLYYPGLTGLLSLSIYLFGLDFHLLHFLCAVIFVACLWLARAYFSADRYGIVGILLPLVLMMAGVLQRQVFNILSDGLFLAIILSALLLWRRYKETSRRGNFYACCLVIALAPLVRFEGIILGAAFILAMLIESRHSREPISRSLSKLAITGMILLLPFALWTLRNWSLYTPDTFNVANGFFFGLKGLQLYATDQSAIPGTPLWHFAIARLTIFLDGFVTTFLGREIASLLSPALWAIILLGLVVMGFSGWFKNATTFERGFVIMMLLFLFVWVTRGGQSLYVVPRYWLSVLPFTIAMVSYGFVALYRATESTIGRFSVSILVVSLVFLIAIAGSARVASFANKQPFYENAAKTIQQTVNFIDQSAQKEQTVATTDWGVMPFYLKRPSYLILNDKTHRLTLQRMARYNTGHLVILDQLAGFFPTARRLTAEYPEIFKHVFDAGAGGPGPRASVYSIDIMAVESALRRMPREN